MNYSNSLIVVISKFCYKLAIKKGQNNFKTPQAILEAIEVQ